MNQIILKIKELCVADDYEIKTTQNINKKRDVTMFKDNFRKIKIEIQKSKSNRFYFWTITFLSSPLFHFFIFTSYRITLHKNCLKNSTFTLYYSIFISKQDSNRTVKCKCNNVCNKPYFISAVIDPLITREIDVIDWGIGLGFDAFDFDVFETETYWLLFDWRTSHNGTRIGNRGRGVGVWLFVTHCLFIDVLINSSKLH